VCAHHVAGEPATAAPAAWGSTQSSVSGRDTHVPVLETRQYLMREEVFMIHFAFCIRILAQFGHFHFRCR
jgi:hypothetical protein